MSYCGGPVADLSMRVIGRAEEIHQKLSEESLYSRRDSQRQPLRYDRTELHLCLHDVIALTDKDVTV
jgi:hypothetical protein